LLYYATIDYGDPSTYRALKARLLDPEKKHHTVGNRIFVLAVPPTVFETVIANLGEAGLSREEGCYSHVVIEKPIGRDLASAERLNALLRKYFEEKQIYRMDHYLAKETVQNILMFRFANAIFEPLWNRRYIDHIEITVAESIGVEHRAGYYEQAGVIRDMFQNHILQLLALTAMEPPSRFMADRVHDEKVKVFRSIRPFMLDRLDETVVLGQYGRGTIEGREVVAYREEEGVSPDSTTPTYAAMKVYIDNWRWQGVPFYLRSGKRLAVRKAEIEIHFRPVPHLMFSHTLRQEDINANTLVLRIQPNEGIGLNLQAKRPWSRVCLDTVLMDLPYRNVLMLEDYARVSFDSMEGDQMLFARGDAVKVSWELLTPLIEALERQTRKDAFPNYAAGSAGPAQAAELLRRDRRVWRPL
jgi:glucose-6-phosphate 1-dehydrogenase